MKITTFKVPQYSAKSVYVIMVDDKPFCTCRGKETVSKIVSALNGYDVKLDDGRLLKRIKELKEWWNTWIWSRDILVVILLLGFGMAIYAFIGREAIRNGKWRNGEWL